MIPEPHIEVSALSLLLPLHLLLEENGKIASAGHTLRRMMGDVAHFSDAFLIDELHLTEVMAGSEFSLLKSGVRVFLRLRNSPETTLRGHGVPVKGRGVLLNLGFGSNLIDVIGQFNLTDADFAPSELAMELLFLHEANRATMGELFRVNARMDEARSQEQTRALTDPLTGLLNRRGIEQAMEAALAQHDDMPFAIAHIDLDKFKAVNDSFGHAAGDTILKTVAGALRRETRHGDAIARYGGDEFLILIFAAPADPDLLLLGQRIISRIEQQTALVGPELAISASIGFSDTRSCPSPSIASMLELSDDALYQAKRTGRGKAILWQPAKGSGILAIK